MLNIENLVNLNPNLNNDIVLSDTSATSSYYRRYSFVDLPISLNAIEQAQTQRKTDILEYKGNEPVFTKSQIYSRKVRGISSFRKTVYATEGLNGSLSNPNSKNLLRVDKNNLIMNEVYETVIPDTTTTLPYQSDLCNNVYKSDTIINVGYNTSPIDMTTQTMPIVANREEPIIPTILEGGILYAGTRFDPTVERDMLVPSPYNISKKAIISSDFANAFTVDVQHTYTDAELKELTGKTMEELYPYIPSWERDKYMGSIVFSAPGYGSTGDFLPSMYNNGNYTYNATTDEYFFNIIKIVTFSPANVPNQYGYIEPNTLQYNITYL